MDIQQLRDELTTDPENYGYASMSDNEVAESLNSPTIDAKGTVPASAVRSFVLLNGLWPRFSKASQTHEDANVQGTAETILQTLAPNSFDEIRMGDEPVYNAVDSMLSVMVSANLMTQEQKSQMMALGDTKISRAQSLGFGSVHHLQVGEARLMEG